MRAKDALRIALQMTKGFTTALAANMADKPLLRSNPETGNHAYWSLGHLVFAEGSLLDEYLCGRPNRYAEWVPLFGIGSKPVDEINDGPSYEELLTEFETIRAALLEHFESLSEDDLDQPCYEPQGAGPNFKTNLECLTAVSIHMMFHAGQIAEARRADGRGPVMM